MNVFSLQTTVQNGLPLKLRIMMEIALAELLVLV